MLYHEEELWDRWSLFIVIFRLILQLCSNASNVKISGIMSKIIFLNPQTTFPP